MRKATIKDLHEISKMLFLMYREIQPELATKNINRYVLLAREHLESEKDFVFIDEENRGIFIMRDVSSIILDKKMYDGVSIYIMPEYRKTKLLKEMYEYMFKNFNGIIIGFTDVNSQHNSVLMKRHKLMGYVYEINKTKGK